MRYLSEKGAMVKESLEKGFCRQGAKLALDPRDHFFVPYVSEIIIGPFVR